MEIYLIRHTTPHVGKGICYGQTDLELSTTFQREFEQLKAILPESFDQVYSSPLIRCTQLANQLSDDITHSNDIKELNFGSWEMQPWSSIDQDELNAWMVNFVDYQVPQGESLLELLERVRKFWKDVLELKSDKVAIVTHAGPIRCILGETLGIEPKNYFKLDMSYGGVSRISFNHQQAKVDFINRVGQAKDF